MSPGSCATLCSIESALATRLYPASLYAETRLASCHAPVITTICREPLLPVLEAGFALADFDDVAVWIADVASRLAVLVYRLREKRCASTLPQLVARLNVRNADIHEATDMIRIGSAKRHRRFIRCGTAANVENEPYVGDFDVRRCSLRLWVSRSNNSCQTD